MYSFVFVFSPINVGSLRTIPLPTIPILVTAVPKSIATSTLPNICPHALENFDTMLTIELESINLHAKQKISGAHFKNYILSLHFAFYYYPGFGLPQNKRIV